MSIQSLDGPLGSSLTPFAGIGEGAAGFSPGAAASGPVGDAISRIVPPWLADSMSNPVQTAMFGPLSGLLQQLLQMLQQMTGGSQYGSGSPYGNCPPSPWSGGPNCSPYGNEQYFNQASGASVGDPHLSFNGNRWNSMVSHPNLLDSNSIPGGFRLSTQVTQPNERGITRNQSATISLDGGATTIGMNSDGCVSVDRYGQNVSLQPGQTIRLGNGASASLNAQGQLTVTALNESGGEITTTMQAKEGGVNLDVNAHDVDLGGALVRGEQMYPGGPGPEPFPEPSPYTPFAQPQATPFPTPFQATPYQQAAPYQQSASYQDDGTQFEFGI